MTEEKKEGRIIRNFRASGYDEKAEDREYWLSRTPAERFGAAELIRIDFHGPEYALQPRLPRVGQVVRIKREKQEPEG